MRLVAAVAFVAAAAPGAAGAGGFQDGALVTDLSRPDVSTRWARPARRAPIRSEPRVGAPAVGRLRLLTEDGFAEAYVLLVRRQGRWGDWVRIRIPGRPNGRTGWVPRSAVGDFHRVTTSVVVDRAARRVTVLRAGRRIARFPAGVGAPATPTPAGRFHIREKFVVRARQGVYGPRALGTSAYAAQLTDWPNGGVVGFHGTGRPGLIPGAVSHGCIRLKNGDVLRFYRLVGVGTPVLVV